MNEEALFTLSYGVYIVSSKKGEEYNGQASNTVFQVTAEPPKIAVCINKENLTHSYIKKSGVFNISVLGEKCTMRFIGRFGFKSGREINKFDNIDYFTGKNGAPVVKENSIAYLECEVESSLDVGTHTLFIGRVKEADILNSDCPPMTYDYYHSELKGKEPETAPTYRGNK